MTTTARRLLTINCHEAWVHQLGYLGDTIDIVDGAPGRYISSWDQRIRPVPGNARLLRLNRVLSEQRTGSAPPYDCIVAHSVTDLMDLREARGPRVLVLHVTLEGRARNEGHSRVPAGYAEAVRQYLDMVGAATLAVAPLKAKSWGFDAPIVSCGVDVDSYPAHDGNVAEGIRVANQIGNRKDYLYWDFHERAFGDIPIRLVGHNPDMAGVSPAANWDDLKQLLRARRFFVHTANPELEDGYNMATVEAMAAGLPILGNRHPTSPVEHGKSGFLSDDPAELAEYARLLLRDAALAHQMGQAAREMARQRFPVARFVSGFREVAAQAERSWKQRAGTEAAPSREEPAARR